MTATEDGSSEVTGADGGLPVRTKRKRKAGNINTNNYQTKKLKQTREELRKKTNELNTIRKRMERYQNRLQRLNVNKNSGFGCTLSSPSPASKVRRLTDGIKLPAKIRKQLVFGKMLAMQRNINEMLEQWRDKL